MCCKNFHKYFSLLFLTFFVNNIAHGYSSVSAGAFQGYQVITQQESAFKTTSTMASLPTIGMQFQFQTTFGNRFGLRIKYENISVTYNPPPQGLVSKKSFKTSNLIFEIPFQHSVHFQSIIKISQRERILYNLDETFQFELYKSKITDLGYGLNYDAQNLGGLVSGFGSTLSVLLFDSHDINNNSDRNLGLDFETRVKLGWIYESGWGNIIRASYTLFYMPNNIDKNTGREIRFFGELIKSF